MSSISSSTWIWHDTEKVITTVRKLATFYGIKFEIGHSNLDLTIDRADLVTLRDKINNCLLDN